MKGPDYVCEEYSEKDVKITIKKLNKDFVLIEGDKVSLEFLGKLLIAQANFEDDCGFQMSPDGAGCSFFSNDSKFGIYIHRLPCEHGKIAGIE